MCVELEKVVPTRMGVFPFVWAWGGDLDAFAETVRDQPAVADLRLVDSIDDQRLFRVEWTRTMTDLGRIIRRADAAVLEARGQRGAWRFELRFGDHDLTPEQRDTLLTALERGYFEEPREITLQELAEVLDLSPTAVSGRMRRGQATLVARSLATDT